MAQPSYSRDELVSELTSYCEFLTQIYLPPEVIQHPPEGGWEHIPPDFVKSFCLGKNDTVADLMKHIPYIRRRKEDDWDPWQIYGNATPVDFTTSMQMSLFLSLMRACGTIVVADPQTGPKPTRLSDPEAPDGEAWRRFQTYTFREFFSMAKEMFRKFEMRKHVHCTSPDVPEAQIYREEGVFTERYDRERCMDRLDEYQEQVNWADREAQGHE
ncbi:hypothetical protein LX32DRAFT_651522 [Colletotrichum zoysiae]|uniref:Uncharacterized protein n=1 Tax=Colletotrichum zoysiae TaxID=1216348 RepID=A0AAD9HLZ1_9PEZI|nr:hypothetical protein LX32DRAFT_651522 [Colletotrichum zoysiae]